MSTIRSRCIPNAGFDEGVRDSKDPMPEHLKPLLGECYPSYELLRRHAICSLDTSVPR